MDLAERCGMCGSWKWCGRDCKNAPKSAEIVPLPVKAPKVKRLGSAFVDRGEINEAVGPRKDIDISKFGNMLGKFDRQTYQRAYMKEYMRRKRAKSKP